MTKSQLKKVSNLLGHKYKQIKESTFAKNTIILRKNQSTKYVYMLKAGEAGIFLDNNSEEPLLTYKQGDYLNSVEVCMSMNSYKTIKAITKCQLILIAWTKQRQDEQKKNIFIPKLEQMKFYEVSIFKNLSYGVMIELLFHFSKSSVSKYQLNQFLSTKKENTCFIITGTLTIEGLSKQDQTQSLKRSESRHNSRYERKSVLPQKSLKLLRFQNGQMLYIDHDNNFKYTCQADICEIISIKTDLLSYFLTPQINKKMKQLKQTQKENLINRRTNTEKALISITKAINRQISRSQIVPIRFSNPIEKKCEDFQKARSVHYRKSNKNFRSFSDQKKKILDLRDKGFKEFSQLNRRKYGRNYIFEKRMQISNNINGGNKSQILNGSLDESKNQKTLKFRSTVYESTNLKEDFAVLKKSSLVKFIRRNKVDSNKQAVSPNNSPAKQVISTNISPIKPPRNEIEIKNLTLKCVSKIRKGFEEESKTLLRNHKRKQMVMEF